MNLEQKAKQIHDQSEQLQAKVFTRINYKILEWEDIKPGYYRSHIYSLAQKALDDDIETNRSKRSTTKAKIGKVRSKKSTNRSSATIKGSNRNNVVTKRARTRS